MAPVATVKQFLSFKHSIKNMFDPFFFIQMITSLFHIIHLYDGQVERKSGVASNDAITN